MPTRSAALVAITMLTVVPAVVQSQPPPVAEHGAYITIFRSPATGIELRQNHLGVHAGFYPTILEADGQTDGENTNFIRIGGSFYLRSSGWSPYLSPGLMLSLDDDWGNGIIAEAGVRFPLFSRAAFRLGAGMFSTFEGETRVNPTVGLDFHLGRKD